jgi:hypothetical protein
MQAVGVFSHHLVLDAIQRVICGRVSEGEAVLEGHSDCFSLCGSALIKSVQALLSEDPKDVEQALGRLEDAQSSVQEALTAGGESAAQCLGAECTLFTSLLLFRSGSLLKGAFYLRRSWKCYEQCMALFAREMDLSTTTNVHLCSLLNFGAGFFLFGCSMLPPSVGYVLR